MLPALAILMMASPGAEAPGSVALVLLSEDQVTVGARAFLQAQMEAQLVLREAGALEEVKSRAPDWPEARTLVMQPNLLLVIDNRTGQVHQRSLDGGSWSAYAVSIAAVELLEVARTEPTEPEPTAKRTEERRPFLPAAVVTERRSAPEAPWSFALVTRGGLNLAIGLDGLPTIARPELGIGGMMQRSGWQLSVGLHARLPNTVEPALAADDLRIRYRRTDVMVRLGAAHQWKWLELALFSEMGSVLIEAELFERGTTAADHEASTAAFGVGAEVRLRLLSGLALTGTVGTLLLSERVELDTDSGPVLTGGLLKPSAAFGLIWSYGG